MMIIMLGQKKVSLTAEQQESAARGASREVKEMQRGVEWEHAQATLKRYVPDVLKLSHHAQEQAIAIILHYRDSAYHKDKPNPITGDEQYLIDTRSDQQPYPPVTRQTSKLIHRLDTQSERMEPAEVLGIYHATLDAFMEDNCPTLILNRDPKRWDGDLRYKDAIEELSALVGKTLDPREIAAGVASGELIAPDSEHITPIEIYAGGGLTNRASRTIEILRDQITDELKASKACLEFAVEPLTFDQIGRALSRIAILEQHLQQVESIAAGQTITHNEISARSTMQLLIKDHNVTGRVVAEIKEIVSEHLIDSSQAQRPAEWVGYVGAQYAVPAKETMQRMLGVEGERIVNQAILRLGDRIQLDGWEVQRMNEAIQKGKDPLVEKSLKAAENAERVVLAAQAQSDKLKAEEAKQKKKQEEQEEKRKAKEKEDREKEAKRKKEAVAKADADQVKADNKAQEAKKRKEDWQRRGQSVKLFGANQLAGIRKGKTGDIPSTPEGQHSVDEK